MTETTRKSNVKPTKAASAGAKAQRAKKTADTPSTNTGIRRNTAKKVKPITTVTPAERYRMIAEAAYYRAEQRGFDDSRCVQDWLEAEAEVDALISSSTQGNA